MQFPPFLPIQNISVLSAIHLSTQRAYEMKDEFGTLQSYAWLSSIYALQWLHCPVYIFDNHNYALYFWVKYGGKYVIHIDQHSDMASNPHIFDAEQAHNDDYIRHFATEETDIGNFIQPLLHAGVLHHVEQVRSERKLLNYESEIKLPDFGDSAAHTPYILDIDLDFRAPEMSIGEYHKTLEKTRKLFRSASIVTIATSPWFIDQSLALSILWNLLSWEL